MKFPKINRKSLFVAILIAAAIIGFFALRQGDNPKSDSAVEEKTYPSAQLSHPPAWSTAPITQTEKDAGVSIKLSRTDPDAILIIRSQTGELDSKFNIEDASKEVINGLTNEVTGFKLLSQTISQVENTKVISIQYQESIDDSQIQNQMVIIPLKQQTYYLVYKMGKDPVSKIEEDVKQLNNAYVKQLQEAGSL